MDRREAHLKALIDSGMPEHVAKAIVDAPPFASDRAVANMTLDVLTDIRDSLERIAKALEVKVSNDTYDAALARWRAGHGKHPDD